MAFDQKVTKLLETYTNCVQLLKAFRRGKAESGGADPDQDQQRHLRKSLKSDRTQIERAYSSKLSKSGGRFKKGDARAISALDRILEKLKGAIANLLRPSRKQNGPDLDYGSLMSLSNASRVEAIKAIDSLSRRLGNPSRSSVASSTPSKASSKASSKAPPKQSSSSKHKRQPSPPSGRAPTKLSKDVRQRRPSGSKQSPESSSQKDKPAAAPPATTPAAAPAAAPAVKSKPEAPKTPPLPSVTLRTPTPPPPTPTQSSSPSPGPTEGNPARRLLGPDQAARAAALAHHRVSMMSFSSGSTKLGEIPERKWRSLNQTGADGESPNEYNVRPMYPLKPYTVEVKERRFWGLFGGRRREG